MYLTYGSLRQVMGGATTLPGKPRGEKPSLTLSNIKSSSKSRRNNAEVTLTATGLLVGCISRRQEGAL